MRKIKVLDFYGKNCGPCKMMEPIINQLISQFENDPNVDFNKYDADENPELALKFNLRTVPTIIFLNEDETIIHKINGATSKQVLLDKISELLNC